MQPAQSNAGQLVETSKRFAQRLLAVGENRFQLLMVEVQEERERLLGAILPVSRTSERRAPGLGGLAGVSRPR